MTPIAPSFGVGRTHLEIGHGHDFFNSDLEHLHDFSTEAPRPDQAVRALLGVGADQEERGVVLDGPKVERGGILKRPDLVRLGKADRVWLLELILWCGKCTIASDARGREGKGQSRTREKLCLTTERCRRPEGGGTYEFGESNLDLFRDSLSAYDDGRLCRLFDEGGLPRVGSSL